MTKEPLSLNILSLLRGNSFLTVSLPLAHKIGLLETIYLMDLLSKYDYHYERNELTSINGVDGYFYACIDDMQKRTTMSRSAQDSCMKKLNLLGLVSHIVKGIPPKRYFKINIDALLEVFGVQIKSPNLLNPANQFAESDKLICQDQQIDLLKPANPIYRNTRSDILDQKVLLPYPSSQDPAFDPIPDPVVVSSHLSKLQLSDEFKQKISAEYSDEDIKLAVSRCLKWKSRKSDEAGLRTTLREKDTWNDIATKQEFAEKEKADEAMTVQNNHMWTASYLKQCEAKDSSIKRLVEINEAGVRVRIKNSWATLGYRDKVFQEMLVNATKQALDQKV